MSTHPLKGTDAPSPIVRGLAALGFVAVFTVVAMVVRPSASTARLADNQPLQAAQRHPAYVGSLEGQELRVDVFVTADGARYTVRTDEGSVVAEMIDAEKLAQRFPQFESGTFAGHMADAPVEGSLEDAHP